MRLRRIKNAIAFCRRLFVSTNQTSYFVKLTEKTKIAPNPIKNRKLSWGKKKQFTKESNWRERKGRDH